MYSFGGSAQSGCGPDVTRVHLAALEIDADDTVNYLGSQLVSTLAYSALPKLVSYENGSERNCPKAAAMKSINFLN